MSCEAISYEYVALDQPAPQKLTCSHIAAEKAFTERRITRWNKDYRGRKEAFTTTSADSEEQAEKLF